MSGDNDPDNAPLYVLPAYYDMADDLEYIYYLFLDNVRRLSPNTVTLIHGYDYCLRAAAGYGLVRRSSTAGSIPSISAIWRGRSSAFLSTTSM